MTAPGDSRPSARTLLGFDYGRARIGVALGNDLAGTAEPLEIIAYRSNAQLFDRIGAIIAEWQPDLLIVGRPLAEDGQEQPASRLAERFARRLAGRFGLEVARVDERYSSLAAQSELREHAGWHRKRRGGGGDDAVAAAIILRQYLDEH